MGQRPCSFDFPREETLAFNKTLPLACQSRRACLGSDSCVLGYTRFLHRLYQLSPAFFGRGSARQADLQADLQKMSICHHKNLVSFEGRVASSKRPSMAKQQRLVVSIIAILDPDPITSGGGWRSAVQSAGLVLNGSYIICSQEMSRARWRCL